MTRHRFVRATLMAGATATAVLVPAVAQSAPAVKAAVGARAFTPTSRSTTSTLTRRGQTTMARAAAASAKVPAAAFGDTGPSARELAIIKERLEREEELEGAMKGAAPRAVEHDPPAVASTPITGAAGGATVFNGLTAADSRLANNGNQFTNVPPDTTMCGGEGKIMEMVNTALRVRSTGGADLSGVVDLNTFFGLPAAYDRTADKVGPSTGDPKCLYDPGSRRWFIESFALDFAPFVGNDIGVTGGAPTGRLWISLAVSKTPNPLGAYDLYLLDGTNDGKNGTPSHAGCPCLPDQPLIGSDAYGFYVSVNEFGLAAPTFNGTQIYAFSKKALTTGGALNGVLYENLVVEGNPAYSWQPAITPDATQYAKAANGTEYFLAANAVADGFTYGDTIVVAGLTNTKSLQWGGTPDLSGAVLASHAYKTPEDAQQKAGPTPLRDCLAIDCLALGKKYANPRGLIQSNDERMGGATYMNGKLYGSQNTMALVDGVAERTAVSWYEVTPQISLTTGSVLGNITRQGYIARPGASTLFPNIAVTRNGKVLIGYSITGGAYYPSGAYTRLTPNEKLIRVVAKGTVPLDDFDMYVPFVESADAGRFGDYSGFAVMGNTVWLNEEWTPTNAGRVTLANWATALIRVNP